ncbi:hypothetical protein LCGC14_3113620 [marine sediment metagenome]|uniref:Lipoprotein n=1 Tax=marine sediment metagenome TaxID=412755 RepID=A0A0F8WTC4_9ZZZZ
MNRTRIKIAIVILIMLLAGCSLLKSGPPASPAKAGSKALDVYVGQFTSKAGLLLLGCGIFGFAWLNGSRSAGAGIVVCLLLIALVTVMARHGELISWIGLIAGVVWFARSCLKRKGFFTLRKDKK